MIRNRIINENSSIRTVKGNAKNRFHILPTFIVNFEMVADEIDIDKLRDKNPLLKFGCLEAKRIRIFDNNEHDETIKPEQSACLVYGKEFLNRRRGMNLLRLFDDGVYRCLTPLNCINELKMY